MYRFNFKYIYKGFKNLFKSLIYKRIDNNLDLLSIKRMNICEECENITPKLGRCKLCGCYCRAKVYVEYDLDENGKSIDGCPLKKW